MLETYVIILAIIGAARVAEIATKAVYLFNRKRGVRHG
jgi:hypothetical protein